MKVPKKTTKLLSPKFIILLLLGGLVLAEIFFRFGIGLGDPVIALSDPEIEYQLTPSRTYKRFGNRIYINADRMRGPELAKAKPQNEKRVLIIGDSVVYGGHRIDQSETIGARLAENLRTVYQNCNITTASIAASSWGPENQFEFIKRYGIFDADLIIYVLSSHDQGDIPTFNYFDNSYAQAPYYGGLHEAASKAWHKLFTKHASTLEQTPMSERVDRSKIAIEAILDQAEQNNIPFMIAYHPTTFELNGTPFPLLEKIAREHDAPYIKLATAYNAKNGITQYRDDIHPNPAGANTAAQRFADEIIKSKRFESCK